MDSQSSTENLLVEPKELYEEFQGPDGYSYVGEPRSRRKFKKFRYCIGVIIIQALLNIFLLNQFWHNKARTCTGSPLNIVYCQSFPHVTLIFLESHGIHLAPVQEAIEYKLVKFAFGLGNDTTPYQGPPSPEVDDAWVALYPCAYIGAITRKSKRAFV